MARQQAVEVKKKQALAEVPDYGEDSASGFEGTKATDLAIPFINVLQPNSPQVGEEDTNAAPGMLLNSVTGELFDGKKGIAFLPCHKDHLFVEWVPREAGGGFVGIYAPDSDVVQGTLKGTRAFGKIQLENGNDLIETHYVYGLLLTPAGDGVEGFGVLSFTSTKIKPYRNWMTALYTMKGRPPLFANRARIGTIKQKNDKGTFYNFLVTPLLGATWRESLVSPATEHELLAEAKGFRDMVMGGLARAAHETQQAEGDIEEGLPF